MSILSEARKGNSRKAKSTTPKSKTNWAAGPVEIKDPVNGEPMVCGLVNVAPWGTMIRFEGACKPRQLGLDAVERFVASHAALNK
jgi:hypothetical protein